MWTAARLLGGADENTVRQYAYGVGVANWFRAIPALEEHNRKPLIDGSIEGVRALADKAQERLHAASKARKTVSKTAAAALVSGYNADPTLKRVTRDPNTVVMSGLEPDPLRDRLRFLHVSLRGWWV